MTANSNIVEVTLADLTLKRCVFRLSAPKHMLSPGRKRMPAKMDPIIEPSTSADLPSFRATQYRKTSTIVAKKALMVAPTPMLL